MKGCYELRHAAYGRGYRFTSLDHARRELAQAVGGGWFAEKTRIGGAR